MITTQDNKFIIITKRFIGPILLTLPLLFIGVFFGPLDSSFGETFKTLISLDNNVNHIIIWDIRITRVIVSFLVGSMLGLAGFLIQLSTKSPLGDPNLFGIGGGATIFLGAAYGGALSVTNPTLFLGCISASFAVAIILLRLIAVPNLTPIKLAIMGIAVGALTISISTAFISHGTVFPAQLVGIISGSFITSDWNRIYYLTPVLLLCLGISIAIAKHFLPIMLGDPIAKSLGVNPIKLRALSMALAGILTGAAVYAAGIIGFIGLIAPHISRKLFGNSAYLTLLGSVFVGGYITLLSDQIGRLVLAPAEIPVGLTTSILGAPTMMYVALKLR